MANYYPVCTDCLTGFIKMMDGGYVQPLKVEEDEKCTECGGHAEWEVRAV